MFRNPEHCEEHGHDCPGHGHHDTGHSHNGHSHGGHECHDAHGHEDGAGHQCQHEHSEVESGVQERWLYDSIDTGIVSVRRYFYFSETNVHSEGHSFWLQ